MSSAVARFSRKVYNPIGFKRGYNFFLWFITCGALLGFSLARMPVLNFSGYCDAMQANSIPGECYWFQPGRIGRVGIILHLGTILPAGILVVLQFTPYIRHKLILLHRINGYVVILLAVVSMVGVLMMTRRTFGGGLSFQITSGLSTLMFLFSMLIAYINIKRLQIEQHRAWMIRAWVYAGFIITMRILSMIAGPISLNGDDPTYQVSQPCYIIDFMKGGNRDWVLSLYPACADFYSGVDPELHVAVMANLDGESLSQIAAGFTTVYSGVSWFALAIHAILAELYLHLTPKEHERLRCVSYQRQLEAGFKNPGNAGLTVQRLGDADPWLPPHERPGAASNEKPQEQSSPVPSSGASYPDRI
ncbi:hypothetical protein SODALDRAFT_337340 [Sodiomyces alkalinus F11]|uniref:Microtubule associated protein n=1 Tax=Sodiomyces alkalinus (strain CBS 110278 / VKM F-3762 / F11) TaxID=1314773 RepID=A0A3N2PLL6_SODAK|nr:hypothetical protein SODALDRAFT_337340 [Sodiomyces alkalinus F11]ROT35294.1 hypothetical protein SODALDRAFT_337340 [Sodiomyces alkalinus F11]